MYLVDTNVWLERLLDQDKSEEVGLFLERTSPRELHVTDFAFHSIGVVLARLARVDVLVDFVQDVFIDAGVRLVSIKPSDTQALVDAMNDSKLDFDDAYQYLAAQQNELTLVSFDSDFDRTDKGKKTPGQILRESATEEAESPNE